MPLVHRLIPAVLCAATSLATCYAQAPATFRSVQTSTGMSLPYGQYAVDLNNDGVPDLVQVMEGDATTQQRFTIQLAKADGTFNQPKLSTIPVPYNEPPSMASGDFNNDGKVDLAFVTGHGTQLAIYLGNGDGTLQAVKLETIVAPAGVSFSSSDMQEGVYIAAADFNHDGKLDLAVQGNSSTSGSVFVIPGNGNGTFGTAKAVYTGSSDESFDHVFLRTGDFDADGNADLAFAANFNCAGGPVAVCSNRIHVLYGDGAFTFENTSPYTSSNIFYLSTGDLDGDGHTDIFGVDVNNRLVTLYGHSRTFSLYTMATSGVYWDVPLSVADFNGDGKMDLVATGATPGNPGQLRVVILLANGPGSFTEQSYTPPDGSTAPLVADFNADTKPDVITIDATNTSGLSPTETITTVLNTTATGNWGGCAYPATGQGIHVCATAGSTTSPVHFKASANSFGDLRKLELWVDGKKIAEQHHTWDGKGWFDLSSAFANGSHSGTFFAADVDNRLQKTTFSFAVAAAGTCSAPTSPGVNVCKPVSGSTVGSPVQVQATANITGTLARMELWVDGVKKYTETSSKTLSTSVSLAAGSHRFVIYAVNTAGTKWQSTVSATVQ